MEGSWRNPGLHSEKGGWGPKASSTHSVTCRVDELQI